MSKHLVSFVTATRSAESAEALRQNLEIVFPSGNPLVEWALLPQVGFNSIFAAYNHGAEKAVGDVLCFLHDDVRILANYTCFAKPLALAMKPFAGWMGVAGSTVLDESAIWWNSNHQDLRGMVGHPGDNEFGVHWNHWPWGQAASFGQVVVLDGCFLMTSKDKFQRIGGFDGKTYDGFHFYDVEATTRMHLAGFRNLCVPIPVLHQSPGRPNDKWHENRAKFLGIYKKQLPCRV